MKKPPEVENARSGAASRVDRVMAAVRDHIRDEGLHVGAVLPGEGDFASSAGVSRPVAREAFRSLAALGIVDIGNGRRPRVAPLDGNVPAAVIGHAVTTSQITLAQIYDVRRTIEHRIVALAARLATTRERAAIVAEAEGMAAAFDDPDHVREHDLALHRHLARASRNPMFALVVEGMLNVIRCNWRVAWDARATDAERWASVEVHLSIARAVRDGDVAAATEAMDLHFDHSIRALDRAGLH